VNLKDIIVQPESVRKAHMEEYADLQKLKLKVMLVLGFLAWAANGFPI
jgi:hypothetical protein